MLCAVKTCFYKNSNGKTKHLLIYKKAPMTKVNGAFKILGKIILLISVNRPIFCGCFSGANLLVAFCIPLSFRELHHIAQLSCELIRKSISFVFPTPILRTECTRLIHPCFSTDTENVLKGNDNVFCTAEICDLYNLLSRLLHRFFAICTIWIPFEIYFEFVLE